MARPIRVLSRAAYRTSVDEDWRPIDHKMNKLVKALKGLQINGYVEVWVKGEMRRYSQQNAGDILQIIHGSIAKKLSREIEDDFTLVPVPNKLAVLGVDEFPTRTSAEAIAALLGDRASVAPCLRWKARLAKARDGGPRNPEILANNLNLTALPEGKLVLYDDMFTSGSHIAACSRILAEAGNMPILAMTFGWATELVIPRPFEWREEILETEPQDIDWASFIFDDV